MRLSTVILPLERWTFARERWRRAEELGFYAAYTYDHPSWLRLKDRPWFGCIPTLTAAALETSRIRLGTMVTTPNFRHPVPLAKDLLSIDDISSGRLTIGVGSGGLGADATVLGKPAWSLRERSERFADFVYLLDELLRNAETSSEGKFYSARDARMIPGTVQQPRPPLFIAANGERGMRLTAQCGEGWIATGRSPDQNEPCFSVVASQLRHLDDIFGEAGRNPNELEKVILNGLSDERPLTSLDAFVDWAGRYQALGFTELVVHWPESDSPFEADVKIFEEIAVEGLAQL